MSYVFQFDSDTKSPFSEEGDAVWVTKLDFWMKRGCFSDQERGTGFPRELSDILDNVMEAYFEWPADLSKTQIRELLLKHGWNELPEGYDVWSHDYPTFDNVLTKWKTGPILAKKAIEADQKQGIPVRIPGGMRCPWCDYQLVYSGDHVAVCVRNPKHKVIWEPWGG